MLRELAKQSRIAAYFTSRSRVDIVRCLGQLNREGFELSVTGDLGARYLVQATANLTTLLR